MVNVRVILMEPSTLIESLSRCSGLQRPASERLARPTLTPFRIKFLGRLDGTLDDEAQRRLMRIKAGLGLGSEQNVLEICVEGHIIILLAEGPGEDESEKFRNFSSRGATNAATTNPQRDWLPQISHDKNVLGVTPPKISSSCTLPPSRSLTRNGRRNKSRFRDSSRTLKALGARPSRKHKHGKVPPPCKRKIRLESW